MSSASFINIIFVKNEGKSKENIRENIGKNKTNRCIYTGIFVLIWAKQTHVINNIQNKMHALEDVKITKYDKTIETAKKTHLRIFFWKKKHEDNNTHTQENKCIPVSLGLEKPKVKSDIVCVP